MYHVLGGELVRPRDNGLAYRASAQLQALLVEARASSAAYGPVDARAAGELGVGSVDNGIEADRSNVAEDEADPLVDGGGRFAEALWMAGQPAGPVVEGDCGDVVDGLESRERHCDSVYSFCNAAPSQLYRRETGRYRVCLRRLGGPGSGA